MVYREFLSGNNISQVDFQLLLPISLATHIINLLPWPEEFNNYLTLNFMSHDKANELIEELFESVLSRYQIGLETLMKSSNFIFDSVNLLHYECHNKNFNRGGSCIDFPRWIKKATINPIRKLIINAFNMLQQLH